MLGPYLRIGDFTRRNLTLFGLSRSFVPRRRATVHRGWCVRCGWMAIPPAFTLHHLSAQFGFGGLKALDLFCLPVCQISGGLARAGTETRVKSRFRQATR